MWKWYQCQALIAGAIGTGAPLKQAPPVGSE